ncbi:hypothetical protein AYK26_00625 [Euryarchaeota archaeon SM23-78]|nr:MAG: hypothetical protein AYK26_00625 [Euryarchaeota archaeon SM23-78]
MRKNMFLALTIVFAIILMSACGNKPDEEVASEVVENLFDNGRNVGWINITSSTDTIRVLQTWIAEHPEKIITAMSADGTGSYGGQEGWLFIYYDTKEIFDHVLIKLTDEQKQDLIRELENNMEK